MVKAAQLFRRKGRLSAASWIRSLGGFVIAASLREVTNESRLRKCSTISAQYVRRSVPDPTVCATTRGAAALFCASHGADVCLKSPEESLKQRFEICVHDRLSSKALLDEETQCIGNAPLRSPDQGSRTPPST